MPIKTVSLTYTNKSEFEKKVKEFSESKSFEYCFNTCPTRLTFKYLDPDSDISFLNIQYISAIALHFSSEPLI